MATFAVFTYSASADAAPELNDATVAQGAAFSRRVAAESMILLKNKDNALPLAQGSKIALFDVTGKFRPGGGGSSAVKAVRIVNIAAGLAEAGFNVDPGSRETAIMVIERCPRGERPLVELYLEPEVFSERCTEKLPLRVDCIHRLGFGEVSGHRVLIKRGPGNRGPTECGTTQEATSGMSS